MCIIEYTSYEQCTCTTWGQFKDCNHSPTGKLKCAVVRVKEVGHIISGKCTADCTKLRPRDSSGKYLPQERPPLPTDIEQRRGTKPALPQALSSSHVTFLTTIHPLSRFTTVEPRKRKEQTSRLSHPPLTVTHEQEKYPPPRSGYWNPGPRRKCSPPVWRPQRTPVVSPGLSGRTMSTHPIPRTQLITSRSS